MVNGGSHACGQSDATTESAHALWDKAREEARACQLGAISET